MEEPWVDLVLSWIPQQRWFAGKGLERSGSRVVRRIVINEFAQILVVKVDYRDKADPEFYQVPVVIRTGPPAPGDPNYIGAFSGGYVFDGVGDSGGNTALLGAIRSGTVGEDFLGTALEELDMLAPRAVATEQSNSSIIFGDRYIMKVFRQLWPGRNPDLALPLELARAGSPHVARPLGWLSSHERAAELTLALVQEYFEAARQGWQLAAASLDTLYAAGADSPGDGYDFTEDVFGLGAATAQVHASLARCLSTGVLDDRRTRDLAERVVASYRKLTPMAPRLHDFEKSVTRLADRFSRNCAGLTTQRIHNDLHLTQVIRTSSSWVLIDFEGEPNVPIERRSEFYSPLRDVACMLRSFDYAAFFALRQADGSARIAELTDAWLTRVRSMFWQGYTSVQGAVPDAYSDALIFFELEKALFEIDYEYNNRPSWFEVAAESTCRMLARDLDGASRSGC